ncbi:MAG: cytochrome c biogenesis protein [Saprospiraceae bacterium]|nr:cytochrome c biogenesis protein [Saprospiraceae bacterium]
MRFIKTYGWKLLGVLLVAYSLIAGMLIPLKPGILEVVPTSLNTDTLAELKITGYNTRFTQSSDTRVWLKLNDEFMIKADSIGIVDDNRIVAFIHIPPYFPVPENTVDCSIIVDNSVDGAFVKPTAVFLHQNEKNLDLGFAYWRKDLVEDLHTDQMTGFPFRGILEETIRNTYYHVPMWFGMMFLFLFSLIFSIRFIRGTDPMGVAKTRSLNQIGLLFGVLGLITGAIWAKFTWNAFWSMDVKQNMAAIATLIYLAYFLLGRSFDDPDKRDRVTSAYNIFAFLTLIPLLFIIPRMTDSLHPGNGGNPALGGEDLDHTMRIVFYPAVIGWTLLGFWMADLLYRLQVIQQRIDDKQH